MKGKIIAGSMGQIQMRQKADVSLAIGELLMGESDAGSQLLQVVDLSYGSQVSSANMEMIAGMALEEDSAFRFYEPELRHYTLATLKSLITIKDSEAHPPKTLPRFFSDIRNVTKEDFVFLARESDGLFLGHLRSGSEVLMDVPVHLPVDDVFAHHILIPATTGKGKSNLMSCILWNTMPSDRCGMLVLDPHDEYYGRNGLGLKDHPETGRLLYYTAQDPPPGARSLRINIEQLEPKHFSGVVTFSQPQNQCLAAYFQRYGMAWISHIFQESKVPVQIHEDSLGVVKRKLANLLRLSWDGETLRGKGVFDTGSGGSLTAEVVSACGEGKCVIVDTSYLSGSAELLVGSVFAHALFAAHREAKRRGALRDSPVISIVLEEAPRVLGRDVLERGQNIFSQIAREGRKFKVGLCAITQLPSLIPKEVLANMNTKIILGIEMAPERQAIIESAAQDLSDDSRNIASLDRGEAIISSNFGRFAMPVKIPLFKRVAEETQNAHVRKTTTAVPELKH